MVDDFKEVDMHHYVLTWYWYMFVQCIWLICLAPLVTLVYSASPIPNTDHLQCHMGRGGSRHLVYSMEYTYICSINTPQYLQSTESLAHQLYVVIGGFSSNACPC